MFKKQNRLPRGVSFKDGLIFKTPIFNLKIKENEIFLNRYAVSIGKKIISYASHRNKIKRIIRQIILNLDENMTKGYDMLFIIRKGVLGKTKEDIAFFIEQALKTRGIIKR